jgi:hypothetical protein
MTKPSVPEAHGQSGGHDGCLFQAFKDVVVILMAYDPKP